VLGIISDTYTPILREKLKEMKSKLIALIREFNCNPKVQDEGASGRESSSPVRFMINHSSLDILAASLAGSSLYPLFARIGDINEAASCRLQAVLQTVSFENIDNWLRQSLPAITMNNIGGSALGGKGWPPRPWLAVAGPSAVATLSWLGCQTAANQRNPIPPRRWNWAR
jgi:hypothetical protein